MPERSRSDEFVTRQRSGIGPARNTDSFTRTSTAFTSSTSTTRGHDPSRHGGPQHPVGGASANSSGAAHHRPTSFSLHGFSDFDTLETRLQKALDSPTLLVSLAYEVANSVCSRSFPKMVGKFFARLVL